MQHFLQVLSGGAHADAMSGDIKGAASTQPADEEGQEHVGGWTTSQVASYFHICELTWADNKFSGKTCPFPGSLPHGNWTCEMQEIPIHGTSFLDEDAQSYPGKVWLLLAILKFEFNNGLPRPVQFRIQVHGTWRGS